MSIAWLFEIEVDSTILYLGTKDITYNNGGGNNAYLGIIDPNSFAGVPEIRVKPEMSSYPIQRVTFTVVDDSGTYDEDDFEGKELIVRQIISGSQTKSWRFVIETSEEAYKKHKVTAKDYLSTFIDGVWPNTGLVKDIFPEGYVKTLDQYTVNEDACVPVVFGTAYIPVQPISDGTNVYHVMGVVGPTYTPTETTSPHEIDGQDVYTGGGIVYNQSTLYGQRVVGFNTAPHDFWRVGVMRKPPLLKYSRNDTSSMTNVINTLKYIIKDWGAVDADFGTSWTTAATAITSRGLTFNRGYYKQESRIAILSNLLTIARATIVYGEKIEIYLDSKTSQGTVTTSSIVKLRKDDANGTFKYTKNIKNENDSGNIEFNVSAKPEDVLITVTVPAEDGGSTDNPVSETLKVVGVTDTQDAQKIGILHYQRKVMKKGTITFKGPVSLNTYKPGDVITLSDADLYGGATAVVINSMLHTRSTTIDFECIVYSVSLEDWGDLSPSAVTASASPSTNEITTLTKANNYADSVAGTADAIDYEALISGGIQDGERLIDAGGDLNDAMLQNMMVITGGNLSIDDGADIEILNGGDINLASGADINVNSGGNVNVASGGDIHVASGGDIEVASGGDINLASGGEITIASGGKLTAYGSTGVEIASGGYLNVLSGGHMVIASGGYLDIYGGTGINVKSGGDINVASGGDINVASGGDINVASGGDIVVQDGGDLILQSATDDVAMVTFECASSRDYEIRPSDSGNEIIFAPAESNSVYTSVRIGSTTKTTGVTVYAHDIIEIVCQDGAAFSDIIVQDYGIQFRVSSTSIGMYLDSNSLTPMSNVTLGESGDEWYALYCDRLYGDCITNAYTSNSQVKAASQYALYEGLATKSSSSHNHSGATLNINLSGTTTVSGAFNPTSTSYSLGGSTSWNYIVGSYLVAGGATPTTACSIRSEAPGTGSGHYAILCETSSGGDIFRVTGDSNVWCVNGVWYTSAESEKRDIKTIDEPVMGKILKAIPKRFKMRKQGDEAEETAGFTVENLEILFPEATTLVKEIIDDGLDENGVQVREPKFKTTGAMKNGPMLPYFTKGFHEHQAYIDSAADRIEDLELLTTELIKTVNKLKGE